MMPKVPYIAFLFALSVLTLVACDEGTAEPTLVPTPNATPSPAPTQVPTPTPTSVPEASDAATAEEVLAASVAAMVAQGSLHFELDARMKSPTAAFGTEIPLSFVGDFQAPDRVHGMLGVSFGFLSIELEAITIGDTFYFTDPQTGQWETRPDAAYAFPNPAAFISVSVGTLDAAVLVGRESLDGTPVYHLQGILPLDAFGGPEGRVEADLWIGVEDSLVWQIAAEGEAPLDDLSAALGTGGLSGTANVAVTIRFSDYGKPVVIEAPQVP